MALHTVPIVKALPSFVTALGLGGFSLAAATLEEVDVTTWGVGALFVLMLLDKMTTLAKSMRSTPQVIQQGGGNGSAIADQILRQEMGELRAVIRELADCVGELKESQVKQNVMLSEHFGHFNAFRCDMMTEEEE